MSFSSTRPTFYGFNGAVASSHPLASVAGLEILQSGGTAFDAALAISAVLCVVQPWASQLGGDGFVLTYEAQNQAITSLNGSGACPRNFPQASPELEGALAIAVPGLVKLWGDFHARFCSLPLPKLLERAIEYSQEGFAASEGWARVFALFPEMPPAFGVETAREGEKIRQPHLARTFQRLSEAGTDDFYSGELAQKIAAFLSPLGSVSQDDLSAHQTLIGEALQTSYRGYNVFTQPPVSQGIALLEMLGLLDGFTPPETETADWLHLQIESKKLAFADRMAYFGENASNPHPTLLSDAWLSERRNLIDPHQAGDFQEGALQLSDTTYFCVADRQGNGVSFIQSVFHRFGSKIVVPETGILFNNRLNGFDPQPEHPNALAPGKRPMHTLHSFLVTDGEGNLQILGGTPGADAQPQTNLQLLSRLLDFKLSPQQAIERPRWLHGKQIEREDPPNVRLEEGFDQEVIDQLQQKSHEITLIPFGTHPSVAQLIQKTPQNGYAIASDPRGESVGLAW